MTNRHDLDGDRLVAIGEAADLLGVSPKTLQRWHETGLLVPAVVLPSGHRRYRLSDVLAIRDAA